MNQQPLISELKIAEGIYFSDYRQPQTSNSSSNCLKSALNQYFFFLSLFLKKNYNLRTNKEYKPSDNLEIIIADYKEFENTIKHLNYSNDGFFKNSIGNNNNSFIKEIQKEDNWEKDEDFSSAILENINVIIKLSSYQKLCLLAVATMDPNNAFLKEFSMDFIEQRSKNSESLKVLITTIINNAASTKEGILL